MRTAPEPALPLDPRDAAQAAFFDNLAPDRLWQEFSPEQQGRLQQFMAAWDLRPGHRVLEPGCGAGRLTVLLAHAVGAQGEVLACDISPEMVRHARARELPDHVSIRRCSVAGIPGRDDHFDRIVCLHAFPHFTNRDKALSAMARLLKPDGHLWIAHFRPSVDVNMIHQSGPAEIRDHLLPAVKDMPGLLDAAGLQFVAGGDSETAGYWVHATRQP